jgi:hypothetical protein
MTQTHDFVTTTRRAESLFTEALDDWKNGLGALTAPFQALPSAGNFPQFDAAEAVELQFNFIKRAVDVNYGYARQLAEATNTVTCAARERIEGSARTCASRCKSCPRQARALSTRSRRASARLPTTPSACSVRPRSSLRRLSGSSAGRPGRPLATTTAVSARASCPTRLPSGSLPLPAPWPSSLTAWSRMTRPSNPRAGVRRVASPGPFNGSALSGPPGRAQLHDGPRVRGSTPPGRASPIRISSTGAWTRVTRCSSRLTRQPQQCLYSDTPLVDAQNNLESLGTFTSTTRLLSGSLNADAFHGGRRLKRLICLVSPTAIGLD